jgi:hypothetical protein
MKYTKKRLTLIGFAWVIGLLLIGLAVRGRAQDIDPVPIPIPVTTITNTYAAKFICGIQKDPSIFAVPDAQAGHYSTKINVHNNTGIPIKFRKKIIQLKGGQVPTPPAWIKFESLNSDWAMEVVCRDIYGHLGIPIPPQFDVVPPYIEGFVIFEVAFSPLPASVPDDPLDVEGIYTYRAEPAGTDAVSIDVVVFPAKKNRYNLPLPQPTIAATPIIVDPKQR